jgi:hypothetical protein
LQSLPTNQELRAEAILTGMLASIDRLTAYHAKLRHRESSGARVSATLAGNGAGLLWVLAG